MIYTLWNCCNIVANRFFTFLYLAYNEKLVGLHEKYQRERSDTFAAIYRDININPRSLPEEHYR